MRLETERLLVSDDDAVLLKWALAAAAANGNLPQPGPGDETPAAADAAFVARLLAAFSEVDRLLSPGSAA